MSAAVTAADRQVAAGNNNCISGGSRSAVTFDDSDDDVRILSPTTSPRCDDAISGRLCYDRKDSADLHVDFSLNLSGIDNDDDGDADNQNAANHVTDINKNTSDCTTVANGCGSGSGNSRRFLTAKYPKQKMGLVRRRIAVEDWIDGELRRLHNIGVDEACDTIVDLDELIEMKSNDERTQYITEQLEPGKISATDVEAFVAEVLLKVESLLV